MEQQKNSLDSQEDKLRNFKEEIRGIAEEEREHERTAHFSGSVDIEEFMPEDAEVWEKIKNESITSEEMAQYMKSLTNERGKVREGVSLGRIKFMAFANNKAGVVIMKREMEKRRNP